MLKKADVTVRCLKSPHQNESFTKYKPLDPSLRDEVFTAVREILDSAGGSVMLKSSRDVYIKPNGISNKPYSYTRPELVEAVIRYFKDIGAKNIFLFENSTQANATRLVFELVGYSEICRRFGVNQVFLDEEKNILFTFQGKKNEAEEADGYRSTTFNMPEFIIKRLIEKKDENLYINLPKLKTHSMAGVTLGIKNQWAFPQHNDRRADHNYNLPYKLNDVLSYIQPDYTLIEGIEATIHGHYPISAFSDQCILPFKVLIGSNNVVAADLAGAKVFGLNTDDVTHLKIALERGYCGKVKSWDDINVIGDISDFTIKQPVDLIPVFPEDVNIIKGRERLCKEGCQNNPLTLLQELCYDYGGTGGFTIVMGKGFDDSEINAVQGKVFVVGHCAIAEVGDALISRLGKKNVYLSGHCNDLCASLNALCHLTKVSPLKFVPIPFLRALRLLMLSKLHGSRANTPNPFANIIKIASTHQVEKTM